MGTFHTFRSSENQQYYFRLETSGDHSLFSEGYTEAAGRDNGVRSVRENAPVEGRYDRRTAADGTQYFLLKAANGEPVGTSKMYDTEAERDNGIASVMKEAPSAEIKEG